MLRGESEKEPAPCIPTRGGGAPLEKKIGPYRPSPRGADKSKGKKREIIRAFPDNWGRRSLTRPGTA